MFDWLNIRVDGLSFLLGLAAGTLFWVLIGQFRNYYPQIRKTLQKKIQEFRDRNFAGVEVALRQEALKKAQHAHLAAHLFALDEIIIQPKLIAPPPMIDPSQGQSDSSAAIPFPYLPDWPELSSQYNIDFLSLADALQGGANLVVVAPAGAGKTVALAHLAALMARKDPSLGVIQDRIPIFLHVHDILSPASQDTTGGPVAVITRAMTPHIPILEQARVPAFIKSSFSSGRILLLLDGLDECAATERKAIVDILRLLLNENPQLRIVTTSTSADLDGLLPLGFFPLGLAAWNRADRLRFIDIWSQSWNERVVPEIKKKSTIELIDPVFVKNWVNPGQIQLTPLEWTLILWMIYAGEGNPSSPQGAVEAFVNRSLPEPALHQVMEKLALEMIKGHKSSLNENDLDGLLAHSALSRVRLFDPTETPPESGAASVSPKSQLEPAALHAQSAAALTGTGLMVEHTGRILRFIHPVIAAYLAAFSCPEAETQDWLADPKLWETGRLTIGYFFAKFPNHINVSNDWIQGTPPLFHQPLASSRWLKFIPATHPIRARIMKRLVDGVLDQATLGAVRIRFTTALICSNDASLGVLFKQLLSSPKANVRTAACLAAGVLQDPKILPQIAALLNDSDSDVRSSACFALGVLNDKEAQEVLVECLSADDEILRQASALSLAADPVSGYEVLQEGAKSENLLTRRSAVFGLAKINESWSRELLEQIAVQDGQWVVRNAASQAIDLLQKPNAHIPHPLTPQSETPWLFKYASTLGQGIAPGDLAVDLLLHALNSGSIEEKLAALDYLRLIPDEKVIQAIFEAASTNPHPLDDAAQLALWFIDSLLPDKIHFNRTPVK